jgi:DNA-binding response OmpR family regulator
MRKVANGVIVIGEPEGLPRRERVALFKQGGFTVITADNGRALLDLLTRVLPRLLMVDVGMLDLLPAELCRRARNLSGPHVPILAIIDDDDEESVAALMAVGANDFVNRREPGPALLKRVAVWANRVAATQKIRQQAADLQDAAQRANEPRGGNFGTMPGVAPAPPSRTAVLAFVRSVLDKARQMAESDFGKTPDEKAAFLGYLIGMLETSTEDDLRFRLSYRDDLASLLRPTGALNDREMHKIIVDWHVTVESSPFQRGFDAGSHDVRQYALDPTWPPMGLSDLLAPEGGKRSW